jgi:hypothetical protein
MTLKAVEKPHGFELREKRADKLNDGSKWLPEDALFDASEQLKSQPPSGALVVAWYTRLENGNLSIKYRCFQEHDRQTVALAADLLSDLQE